MTSNLETQDVRVNLDGSVVDDYLARKEQIEYLAAVGLEPTSVKQEREKLEQNPQKVSLLHHHLYSLKGLIRPRGVYDQLDIPLCSDLYTEVLERHRRLQHRTRQTGPTVISPVPSVMKRDQRDRRPVAHRPCRLSIRPSVAYRAQWRRRKMLQENSIVYCFNGHQRRERFRSLMTGLNRHGRRLLRLMRPCSVQLRPLTVDDVQPFAEQSSLRVCLPRLSESTILRRTDPTAYYAEKRRQRAEQKKRQEMLRLERKRRLSQKRMSDFKKQLASPKKSICVEVSSPEDCSVICHQKIDQDFLLTPLSKRDKMTNGVDSVVSKTVNPRKRASCGYSDFSICLTKLPLIKPLTVSMVPLSLPYANSKKAKLCGSHATKPCEASVSLKPLYIPIVPLNMDVESDSFFSLDNDLYEPRGNTCDTSTMLDVLQYVDDSEPSYDQMDSSTSPPEPILCIERLPKKAYSISSDVGAQESTYLCSQNSSSVQRLLRQPLHELPLSKCDEEAATPHLRRCHSLPSSPILTWRN